MLKNYILSVLGKLYDEVNSNLEGEDSLPFHCHLPCFCHRIQCIRESTTHKSQVSLCTPMPGWYTRMQPDRDSSHNIPENVWTHSWVEMLRRRTHYLQHVRCGHYTTENRRDIRDVTLLCTLSCVDYLQQFYTIIIQQLFTTIYNHLQCFSHGHSFDLALILFHVYLFIFCASHFMPNQQEYVPHTIYDQ